MDRIPGSNKAATRQRARARTVASQTDHQPFRVLGKQMTAVEIHWVPGHMGIAGNEKAYEAGKEAAERAGTRLCPEQFASLAHVGWTITQCKLKKAKHWFRSRHDRQDPLQKAKYDPTLETKE